MSPLDRDLLAERAIALGAELARRLVKAAGFRNLVAHADERLDMRRVHDAALLLAALRDRLPLRSSP